jgi:hypothetical protein
MWSGVQARFVPFEVSDLYHCVEPHELHRGLGERPPTGHTVFAPGKTGTLPDTLTRTMLTWKPSGTLRAPTMSRLRTSPKIRDEILEDATALVGKGFSAHFAGRENCGVEENLTMSSVPSIFLRRELSLSSTLWTSVSDTIEISKKCGRRNGQPQGCSLRSHRFRRLKPLTQTLSPAVHSAMPSMLHRCTSDLNRRGLLSSSILTYVLHRHGGSARPVGAGRGCGDGATAAGVDCQPGV